MTWILAIKIFGAVAGIIGTAKVIYEILIKKRHNLREEYTFSKTFLNDVTEGKLHPFSLQKGYQALAGTSAIKTNEIEYILTLKEPDQSLRDYIFSAKYLEHSKSNGYLEIGFKDKFKSKYSRLWRKLFYFIVYFIFALLAISPFFFGALQSKVTVPMSEVLLQLSFSLPLFGVVAWLNLAAAIRIKRAEVVVKNQEKHSTKIQRK